MDSDWSSDEDLPQNIINTAKKISLNLLPPKSKTIYINTYQKFVTWKVEKKIKSVSEDVLLVYFDEMSTNRKPTTLWSIYSMLKTTLKHNDGIDISTFSKLKSFLKNKTKGHKPKKSKVFTIDDVRRFITEASDKEFLLKKVVMVIGISGACRREEFYKMTINDIHDHKTLFKIDLPYTKNNTPRSFVVSEEFYSLIQKYISLRPENTPMSNFFIKYNNGRCYRQPIGIHKFGMLPKEIAYLELEDTNLYTGHSFRRPSATIFVDAGANLMELKRLGGWKSSTVAKGYVAESMANKKRTSDIFAKAIMDSDQTKSKKQRIDVSEENASSSSKVPDVVDKDVETSVQTIPNSGVTLHFNNCTNLRIFLPIPLTLKSKCFKVKRD